MQLAYEQVSRHESSLEAAERQVVLARGQDNPAMLVTALTDLGILLSHEGKCKRTFELLEEALDLARAIGDQDKERDVLGNLGTALAGKDPTRALELVQRELELARQSKQPFAEKTALGHLGTLYLRARDPMQGIPCFHAALAIARSMGDRQHEGELLWLLAVGHADLGQREEEELWGQSAIDVYATAQKPQAVVLREHLDRFKTGAVARLPDRGDRGEVSFATGFFVGNAYGSSTNLAQQSGPLIVGPSWLRLGFSALKAIARFVGSGMRRVPLPVYEERQSKCGACEHHTGLRCKLCGCFTRVKAWLPHEECPMRKWPTA
jgi:tetratricopeptide (TPR) repeat protein